MKTHERDFDVGKFYFYYGPNHYLASKALVFNLFIAPEGPEADFYKPLVLKEFPQLRNLNLQTVADLFAYTALQVLRMDRNLYIHDFSVSEDQENYIIAIDFWDDYTAEDAVILVSDWFKTMNQQTSAKFEFREKFHKLQKSFEASLPGDASLTKLIGAGLQNEIPVFFLHEENTYQWGYGSRQLRGGPAFFHRDGIQDIEFARSKDMVTDFLLMVGLPVPAGKVCYQISDALKEAEKLGYPVVVKPIENANTTGFTDVKNATDLKTTLNAMIVSDTDNDTATDGIIIQKHIGGYDHRLLTVNGKFVAALKWLTPFVTGNGADTIEQLIQAENTKALQQDKKDGAGITIDIDHGLEETLQRQNLNLSSVPSRGTKIFLRPITPTAGVPQNVTPDIHPQNKELAESLAAFFNLKSLEITLLTEDISRSWKEGNFCIVELQAGPGVFMPHAEALKPDVDIPYSILLSHFSKPELARIPIVAGNKITARLASKIYSLVRSVKNNAFFAALIPEGVFFNEKFFCQNESHDQNVKVILRHPQTDFALFNHSREGIYDYGFFHQGADILILDHPNWAEEALKEQLLPEGLLLEITDGEIYLKMNSETIKAVTYQEEDKEDEIISLLKPYMPDMMEKYGL